MVVHADPVRGHWLRPRPYRKQCAAAVGARDTISWSGTRPGAEPSQPCTAPRESCVRSETNLAGKAFAYRPPGRPTDLQLNSG